MSGDGEGKLRSAPLAKRAIQYASSFIKFIPIKLVYNDDIGLPGLEYWNIQVNIFKTTNIETIPTYSTRFFLQYLSQNDFMVPEFCIESEQLSYSTKHLWTTIKSHIKAIRPRGAHTIIAGRVTLSDKGKCLPPIFEFLTGILLLLKFLLFP